ncbi:MAG: AAA family ATPase, partial [Deltaproteobacteria bacterium]|nr:AAA family ATPase [Deltaproteobacteria bacterium]
MSGDTPVPQTGTFTRNGEFWTISYCGATFSLKDIKGLAYLCFLLQHPDEEFHALDLIREPGAEATDGPAAEASAAESGLSIGRLGDAGEILDAQAKREYRRRLGELRAELAELRERGDTVRGEEVEAEIDFIQRQLVHAVGLGGRARRARSPAERARLNVTRAIKSALRKVAEQNRDLGELLESSVKTGLFCVYAPPPGSPRLIETVPAKEYRFITAAHEPASQSIPLRQAEIGSINHESKTSTVSDSQTGERRHLTVLFCDLVGSTEIVARLDPEEWRDMVAGYYRAAAEMVARYGGHVAKYLGDGVMAFFGYPEAHDNDAERAIRASLELLDAISKLNEQTDFLPLKGGGPGKGSRPKLTARVGIDSGAVVVGAGAGKDADVFGEAPNIAARAQAAAEAGAVLITDAVYRLVSGLFVVESRGALALKGVERSLQLYQVLQPSGVRGRLEATAAVHGLTPFVGREDELRLLNNRWERALEGEGQVVLVVGEAGIGKSRLVQRFHEQIAGTPHTWIESGASAFFQNTPFYAVIEMLRQF